MKRKLKVAYIVKILVPYRVYFFHLLQKMKLAGDSLFLIDKDITPNEEKVLKQYPVNYKVISSNIKLPSFLFKQSRFPRYLPFGLFPLLKSFSPDIIICPEYSLQTIIAIAYKILFRARIVIWCSLTEYDERYSFWGQKYLRNIIRKFADAFVCYSTSAKNYLIKKGINEKRCFIAENCTDVVYFRNRYDSAKDLRPNKKARLLYVGALTVQKGIPELLNVLEKLISLEWEIVFVGSGELTEHLKKIACEKFSNRITVSGTKSREQLIEQYLNSDIFIFPTHSDVWGHVIDEAMALGCAVISSNRAIAALELIEDGVNGFVYDINNKEELLNKLKTLIENPQLTRKMGVRAMDTMKEHDEEKSSESYIKAIEYAAEKIDK